jgi:hypothetical protein
VRLCHTSIISINHWDQRFWQFKKNSHQYSTCGFVESRATQTLFTNHGQPAEEDIAPVSEMTCGFPLRRSEPMVQTNRVQERRVSFGWVRI